MSYRGRLSLLTIALGFAAVAAYAPRRSGQGPEKQGPIATPAPPVPITQGDSARRAILAYGRTLQFDTSEYVTDEQYLLLPSPTGVTVGPWLSVSPAVGSTALTHEAVVAGRIIGRAILRGRRGTVTAYLYVDSTAAGRRALWAAEGYPLMIGSLKIHERTRGAPNIKQPPTALSAFVCWPCSFTWCGDTTMSRSLSRVIAAVGPGPVE